MGRFTGGVTEQSQQKAQCFSINLVTLLKLVAQFSYFSLVQLPLWVRRKVALVSKLEADLF
jgi:hypothetical protein